MPVDIPWLETAPPAIRLRSDDDLAACTAILVRVHEADGYPVDDIANPVGWLTPSGLVRAWVAELDGAVVGHVALTNHQSGDNALDMWSKQSSQSAERIGVLARLFVDPNTRGHAIGERLVRTVMNAATTQRSDLVLDVMTKDTAAIRLYERLGWQRTGTIQHTFGDNQLIPAYCYVAPHAGQAGIDALP